jgi:hypothetical protein
MKIIFEAPLNQVSFGNVSYNFLKEFYKIAQNDSSLSFVYHPISNPELSAFDNCTEDFKKWLKSTIDNRYSDLSKDAVTLKLWHINGAEKRISPKQVLYTFYELDEPTVAEKAIVGMQDATIFSSSYAARNFAEKIGNKTYSAPLGFDSDFYKTGKTYLTDKVHFLLMGKFEKRKHTDKIIKMWIKKYGNNSKYQLTCSITNPFFDAELMKKIINGYRSMAWNVNFLPYVGKNSEVNDIMNSIDIDLSGLSGAEGWGLPAFNATCLGKWSVVLNCTSHKDWANDKNSILVEPSGKIPAYDGTFFKEGSMFNQGNIFDFSEDAAISAIEKAANFAENKVVNAAGIETGQKFTYHNTVSQVCDIISRLQ